MKFLFHVAAVKMTWCRDMTQFKVRNTTAEGEMSSGKDTIAGSLR